MTAQHSMPWAQRLAPLLPGLRSLRHRLHRSPEIAFEEYNTASAVAGWLWGEAGLTPMAQGVGGTGLIFRVEGRSEDRAPRPHHATRTQDTAPSTILTIDC